MALADVGAAMEAEGVTSAVTVDNARSFANRGKGRGHRVPTIEGKPCKRGHTLRYGPGAAHEGKCAECERLNNLARHSESNRVLFAARKVVGSEAYWKSREMNWKKRGIRIADGSFLDRETYTAVLAFQRGRCAVCGLDFTLSGQLSCADHHHRSGLFRGVVCGGKRGCNLWAITRVETGRGIRRRNPRTDDDIAYLREVVGKYLADPPYARWIRSRK